MNNLNSKTPIQLGGIELSPENLPNVYAATELVAQAVVEDVAQMIVRTGLPLIVGPALIVAALTQAIIVLSGYREASEGQVPGNVQTMSRMKGCDCPACRKVAEEEAKAKTAASFPVTGGSRA